MADQRRLRRQKSSTVREKIQRKNVNSSETNNQQQPQQQQQSKPTILPPPPSLNEINKKNNNGSSSNKEEEPKPITTTNNISPSKANESKQEDTNASTSGWSWFPSFLTSLFVSSTPEKTLNESASSTQQQQQQEQQLSPSPPPSNSLAFTTTKIPINEKINEHVSHPSNANTIAASTALQQPDADEKCSRGNGDASPQASDEGSAKNKSKELIPADSLKKDIIIPKESEGTLISVNLEEGNIPDAMLKELIPQPDNNIKQEQIPKLKDVFELEASAFGAVSTEPAIKPKCSFNRVSFSRSHTVYFLPNTKQRLHKKVVRSRHDAWRRYGALMVIHKRGGWSYTMNGKAKNFQKVDKDTPLPPAPVLPPILTEEEFHKRPIITIATSSSKSKRQRQEKKESKGDTDTSVSEEEPPSC